MSTILYIQTNIKFHIEGLIFYSLFLNLSMHCIVLDSKVCREVPSRRYSFDKLYSIILSTPYTGKEDACLNLDFSKQKGKIVFVFRILT